MQYTTCLLILMGLALLTACGKKEAAATDTKEPAGLEIPVRVVPVERYGTAAIIPATGMLAAETETRLSFKMGGLIQKIYAEEGDRVQKGQLLAKLNLTEISAQVKQAEYGVEKASRDLERVQNLYRDSAATLEQVQNLNTVLDLAKQNLEIGRFNLQYAEIRSPHAGIVIKKLAREGELAGPGLPILVLSGSGPSDWIVRVSVPDKDWAKLQTGDEADVGFDAYPDEVFKGKISMLAPTADPMNGLYVVEVKINAKGKRLAPGLFAKAELKPRNTGAGALVPIEAIIEGDGKRAYVFVPGADGVSVRKIPVLIGELNNTHASIIQGIEGIDSVITAGSPYLNEQARIRIVQ